jgi:hypothetical protein
MLDRNATGVPAGGKPTQASNGDIPHVSTVLADIQTPSNRNFIVVALVVLLISRLSFQFLAAPLPDEAYYWLWGLHPDLSYYDHPPLQAWLQGVDARVFGWNLISLRLSTWFTTAGTIALLLLWSRRLSPVAATSYFLATTAVCFASPLIFIYTAMTYHDHLLIFLSYLSASLFVAYLVAFAARTEPPVALLYLGAVVLGLAGLTKYNAVFLGLGVAGAVFSLPALRPLLKSPHIYAAGIMAALLQLPVLYWNATHGLSSFRYHLWERLNPGSWTTDLSTLGGVFMTSIVVLSPFLVGPLVGFLRSRPTSPPQAVWQALGFWTFVCSTVAFFLLCLFVYVHFYWNMEAYLIFLPIALLHFRSIGWLKAHLVFGMICSALFAFNYAALPLSAIAGQADFESSRSFGWAEIGDRVAKAKAKYDAAFVAGTDWQSASQLGFALRDKTVECFEPSESQFRFWLNKKSRNNQDAIVLVDEPQFGNVHSVVAAKFQRLELIDTVNVVRFGKLLTTYRIYRGISFIGEGPAELNEQNPG